MRLKKSQRMLKYHKMQAPQGMFTSSGFGGKARRDNFWNRS